LQPPKNFKKISATPENIIKYIESHRVILSDGETTVKNYMEGKNNFEENNGGWFISLFPCDIRDFAIIYWKHFIKKIGRSNEKERDRNTKI
jgi:hypothetical protein